MTPDPTALSPQSIIVAQDWEGLRFEYGQLREVGEFDFAMPQQAISVAFAPHEQVTWSVDGKSKQTTALPAGSVFLYGDRQFTWHERQQTSEYANFLFQDDWLRQVADENEIELSKRSNVDSVAFAHRVIFPDPTILHIAQLLRSEVQTSGAASGLLIESLRNVLAVHLLRNYVQTEEQTETGTAKPIKKAQTKLETFQFQRVKDYIEENLAEELAIAQLAALIPMSPYHFARAFKATVGETPHRYITQRRIERAKVLLSVTDIPAWEIAMQTGFSNPSHFSAQFRRYVGATPRQYRA